MAGDAAPMASPASLVIVGGTSRDRITDAAGQAREVAGGAGRYAALGAAAAAGTRPGIAGIVSDDISATAVRVLARWVDVTGLRRVPGARLRFEIAYDTAGQAQYLVDDAGAEELATPESVRAAYPALRAAHLCPYGTARAQARMATEMREQPGGERLFLSATTFAARIRADPGLTAQLASLVDLLVCSAEDAMLLTGTATLAAAARRLTPAGQRPGMVCITDASRGACLLRQARRPLAIGARPARQPTRPEPGRASQARSRRASPPGTPPAGLRAPPRGSRP